MLDGQRRAVADALFETGAIRFGQFRLKLHEKQPDAPLSPIYVDLRVTRSFPSAFGEIATLYQEMVGALSFDVLADVPTAATPIVAVLSYLMKVPMISPRLEVKEHGQRRPIDGTARPGSRVLLVDDLITRADSKLEAISLLESHGFVVKDVAVLVDREQGGAQELQRRGYDCHSSFRLIDLLQYYREVGRIDAAQLNQVMEYLRSAS